MRLDINPATKQTKVGILSSVLRAIRRPQQNNRPHQNHRPTIPNQKPQPPQHHQQDRPALLPTPNFSPLQGFKSQTFTPSNSTSSSKPSTPIITPPVEKSRRRRRKRKNKNKNKSGESSQIPSGQSFYSSLR